MQGRNWKLTESGEEVPALRQKCSEACERVESLEVSVKELEVTLAREREESKGRVEDMEAQHQDQRKVHTYVRNGVCCW